MKGDGSCFVTGSGVVIVAFSSRDREFVEAVRFGLGSSNKIRARSRHRDLVSKINGKRYQFDSLSYRFRIKSRILADFIKTSWEEVARAYPLDFIRGFVDAEGSFQGSQATITVYGKDLSLLRFVKSLAGEQGIYFNLCYDKGTWRGVHRLSLRRREMWRKYKALVGSAILRKQAELERR